MGEQWVLTLAEARALRRGLGPVLRAARALEGAGLPVHFILPMGGTPRLVQGAVGEQAQSRVTVNLNAVDLQLDTSHLLRTAKLAQRFADGAFARGGVVRGGVRLAGDIAAPISAGLAVGDAPESEDAADGDAPLILIEDEIPAGPSGAAAGLDGGAGDGAPAVAAAQAEGPENGAGDAPTPALVTGEAGTAEGGGAMRPPTDAAPDAPDAPKAPLAPVSRAKSGVMWTAEEDARLIGIVSEAMARGGSRRSAGQKAAKILQRGAPGIDYRLTQILAARLEAAVAKALAQGVQPVTLISPAPPADSVPGAEAEVAAWETQLGKPASTPAPTEAPPAPAPVAARPARAMPPVDACKSGKARILRETMNSKGYRAGWSADLDFAVFEGLALSQKVPQIAAGLGVDTEEVKWRIAQLNQAAMMACGVDRVTIDSGRLLAEEIRDRAAWFKARAAAPGASDAA